MAARNKFDRTKWRVERERFGLTDPAPAPPEADLSLRPAIAQFFKNIDSQAGSAIQKIADKWKIITGEKVASHSCPGRLVNNVLYVYVDSSTWLAEIKRFHSAAVLSEVQEALGHDTVKEVRYQVNPSECRTPLTQTSDYISKGEK